MGNAIDTPQAIVKWAEKKGAPACEPKYRRLTDADRSYILALSQQKLTQAEIAQRVGCTQQAVSQWLRKCQDTTKDATLYLRGSALKMARKVVASDDGKVLIQALKGVNVLQEQQQQGVTVIVGNGGQVNVGVLVSPPARTHLGEGE